MAWSFNQAIKDWDVNRPASYPAIMQRWLDRQKEAKGEFGRAEAPLTETAAMFRPGGTYGAGQKALIEGQARKTKAEALSGFVSSGMASGTNVAGMQARVGKDVTTAKLGVEDVRTEKLATSLSQLSGLRGAAAQQYGTVQEPSVSPFLAASTASQGQQLSYSAQLKGQAAQQEMQAQQIASQERMAAASLKASKSKQSDQEIAKLHY